MLKNRFRNYGLWVSIAALVPLMLSAFGINLIDEQKYAQLVNCVLTILVTLGIVNNPSTDNRWYKDDKLSSGETAEIKQ